jgi:hypothetical protein
MVERETARHIARISLRCNDFSVVLELATEAEVLLTGVLTKRSSWVSICSIR